MIDDGILRRTSGLHRTIDIALAFGGMSPLDSDHVAAPDRDGTKGRGPATPFSLSVPASRWSWGSRPTPGSENTGPSDPAKHDGRRKEGRIGRRDAELCDILWSSLFAPPAGEDVWEQGVFGGEGHGLRAVGIIFVWITVFEKLWQTIDVRVLEPEAYIDLEPG